MASKGALFHLVNEAAPDQTVRTRTRGPANTTRSVAQNKMSQSHVYRFWFERRRSMSWAMSSICIRASYAF